jgi:hypothetical protein
MTAKGNLAWPSHVPLCSFQRPNYNSRPTATITSRTPEQLRELSGRQGCGAVPDCPGSTAATAAVSTHPHSRSSIQKRPSPATARTCSTACSAPLCRAPYQRSTPCTAAPAHRQRAAPQQFRSIDDAHQRIRTRGVPSECRQNQQRKAA